MTVYLDKRRRRWRYRINVRMPDGSTERISGTPTINTRRAALEEERAHIERTLRPPPPKVTGRVTFKAFAERWATIYPARARNRATTRREKEIHLRLHLVPALGRCRLEDIRGEVLDTFVAQLESRRRRAEGADARPLSEKSVRNVLATLRRILASAVEWGELASVPAMPKVKVPDPPWDWYRRDESERLFAAARSDEERALLMFAVKTGARAGEQLALEWTDLDFAAHLVVFRRSRPCHIQETGPTKSGHERRVPLSPQLEQLLRKVRHLRGPLVFCRSSGLPLSVYQLHEHIWWCARKAGLRELTWHELRHSFASQLVSAGVPLRQVQEWLGHSTIAMTMRYAHLAPGSQNEQIKLLDGGAVPTGCQTAAPDAPDDGTSRR